MKSRMASILVGFFALVVPLAAQTPEIASESASPLPAASPTRSTENPATPSNAVSSSGTTNYIPVWTGSTKLGNSIIYQTGDRIGIRTTHPGSALDVNGNINAANGFQIAGGEVLSLAGSTSAANLAIGYGAFSSANGSASLDTAVGAFALNAATGEEFDTAIGAFALYSETGGGVNTATGSYALNANVGDEEGDGTLNTADGAFALTKNTTGNQNTAVGAYALFTNKTGSDLTCVGYDCTSGAEDLHNAAAIGAHAVVSESNSLVLGGTGIYAVKVGIGTATPSNVLTIAQGAGHPVSDGWETFSSRRWKTNVRTLPGALTKVERLRGVSYDLKDSGKHEIGVIAEEVGAVVPEVVTYEDNGTDARSVDYSRLTALLIEAVKHQQREIAAQRAQLRKLAAKDDLLESRLVRLEGDKAKVTRLAISLTPKGDCEGLNVANETAQRFEVHQLRGGHSGAASIAAAIKASRCLLQSK
jgi:Chaperone of endosialidase